MYILSTILFATARVASTVIWLYTLVIIVSAILSWFHFNPYHPAIQALRTLTEPVYWRIRRRFPFLYVSGLDLTPIVVLLALQFIDSVLVGSLNYLAVQARISV